MSTFKKIFTKLITMTVNKYCSKYKFFITWIKLKICKRVVWTSINNTYKGFSIFINI